MSKPSLNKERRAWLASLKDGDEVASTDGQIAAIAKVLGWT